MLAPVERLVPEARSVRARAPHPATHSGAGKGTPTADLVPYGAHLRLRSTFNLQSLPTLGARVVARALQRYGMFLADGGNIALTAQSDVYTRTKWSGLLAASDLVAVAVSDFDMVEGGARIPPTLDCKRAPP
jgi:serine/threonine-protein kinase